MTGLETLIVKELITWGAKAFFDAVNDDENSLTAEQANLTEEAQKAIIENLPRHLKL